MGASETGGTICVWVIDPDLKLIRTESISWDYKDYPYLNQQLRSLGKFRSGSDTMRINDSEAILVDDEGLLHGNLTRWVWVGYPYPLAGIGIILGNRGEHACSTRLTKEFLTRRVLF